MKGSSTPGNRRLLATLFALASILGLAPGCYVVDSEDIETTSIWAHFWLEQEGDEPVIARGELRVGGPLGSIVDLSGGEQLRVNGTRLAEWMDPITGYRWLRGIVPADPDGSYLVELVRTEEVLASAVEMPETPLILDTFPEELVQTMDRITLWWDTSGAETSVDILVEGSCISTLSYQSVPDNGSFETDWVEEQNPAQPSDCPIKVSVSRGVTALVSSAFKGGYSEAHRTDSVTLGFDSYLD